MNQVHEIYIIWLMDFFFLTSCSKSFKKVSPLILVVIFPILLVFRKTVNPCKEVLYTFFRTYNIPQSKDVIGFTFLFFRLHFTSLKGNLSTQIMYGFLDPIIKIFEEVNYFFNILCKDSQILVLYNQFQIKIGKI